MNLLWTSNAWEDYTHWQKENSEIASKSNDLIKDIRRSPFTGLGKPEPLRDQLSGWWSRRISAEHRLVYRVEGKGKDQRVVLAQCRYHY